MEYGYKHVSDEIKLFYQFSLRYTDFPSLPRWMYINTMSLCMEMCQGLYERKYNYIIIYSSEVGMASLIKECRWLLKCTNTQKMNFLLNLQKAKKP